MLELKTGFNAVSVPPTQRLTSPVIFLLLHPDLALSAGFLPIFSSNSDFGTDSPKRVHKIGLSGIRSNNGTQTVFVRVVLVVRVVVELSFVFLFFSSVVFFSLSCFPFQRTKKKKNPNCNSISQFSILGFCLSFLL